MSPLKLQTKLRIEGWGWALSTFHVTLLWSRCGSRVNSCNLFLCGQPSVLPNCSSMSFHFHLGSRAQIQGYKRSSWASFKDCSCIAEGRWPNSKHYSQWKHVIPRKSSEDKRARKDLNLLRSMLAYVHRYVQEKHTDSSFWYSPHRTELAIIQIPFKFE